MADKPTMAQKIKTGLIIATVSVLVLIVGAEAYSAINSGGLMRMEVIDKVLDTLNSMMGSPPEEKE